MTEKDLESLWEVAEQKRGGLAKLSEKLVEELKTLNRGDVVLNIRSQYDKLSQEWVEAVKAYQEAGERYWHHDRYIELGASWRNFKNREETEPNSASNSLDK